jgi:hypothetical protein
MYVERENIREITYNNVQRFIDKSNNSVGEFEGVEFAALKGSQDDDVNFYTYIALSHLTVMNRDKTVFTIIYSTKSGKLEDIYNKVLNLEVSSETIELYSDVQEDVETKMNSELYFTSKRMPYVVVTLGETEKKKEEFAGLFFAAGVLPQNVFAEVKNAVRDHKLSSNLSNGFKNIIHDGQFMDTKFFPKLSSLSSAGIYRS